MGYACLMGCGCRKNKTNDTRTALDAATRTYHEVWLNNTFTGRRYTSLIQAQSYANKINGNVVTTQ
jgi:hypothetical protein